MPKSTNPKPFALITGASSGIGFHLARQFVMNGHNVVLVADNKSRLNEAAKKLRMQAGPDCRIEILQADLSKSLSPQKVYDAMKAMRIEVDILVNNAGVGVYGDFTEETDLKAELAMIQLNVNSVVQLTKLFAQDMVKRKYGKILITSSIAAITSTPMLTVYSATKAFDYIFAEGLRAELKDKGITVTALMPGATDTNFFTRADAEDAEIAQDKEALADPADVAKLGYEALMDGRDHVIHGLKNKVMAAIADIAPKALSAEMSTLKRAKAS